MHRIIYFIQNQRFSIPMLLLVICILSYGILIPTLGLYWDGWPYMWQYHVFGPGGYPDFVASDRPHSAWIFMLITWLFGYSLLAYHLAALVFHWLSALFIWWSLNIIWPEKRLPNVFVALFVAVYPGFLQQPISLPYCHHLSHMAMFFFSMWGMLFSLRNPKKYWWLTAVCVLSTTIVNFSLEYFTPLELLRPIMIWLVLKGGNKDQLKRIVKSIQLWLPYLISLFLFLLWRVFVFKFPTYTPKLMDEFTILTGGGAANLFTGLLKDLYTVSVIAWSKVFQFPTISGFGTTATYFYFLLTGAVVIILAVFFFLFINKREDHKKNALSSNNLYAIQLILIGLFALLLSGILYWVLKLPILVEFAWDRLNLSFVFGVSLLLVGLVESIFRFPWLKIITVAFLIGLAVGFHFQNTMSFKRDWETFQNFFWQLTWRAPDLHKGTILMTTNLPLRYYSDNSLTAPFNWTYDPENHSHQLNYLFYFADVRLKSRRLIALEKGLTIQQPYRSFYFEGNTDNALVVKYSLPSCVQILDPVYANAGILPNLTQLEADSIPLSNLSQIISDPIQTKRPPAELLPKEPEHGWCYYFEKADLARQKGDWQNIANLGKEADNKGFKPRNPSEWLPFIEAYMRIGKWEKVASLTNASIQVSDKYLPGLCYTWQRIQKDSSLGNQVKSKLTSLQAEYNCSQ